MSCNRAEGLGREELDPRVVVFEGFDEHGKRVLASGLLERADDLDADFADIFVLEPGGKRTYGLGEAEVSQFLYRDPSDLLLFVGGHGRYLLEGVGLPTPGERPYGRGPNQGDVGAEFALEALTRERA